MTPISGIAFSIWSLDLYNLKKPPNGHLRIAALPLLPHYLKNWASYRSPAAAAKAPVWLRPPDRRRRTLHNWHNAAPHCHSQHKGQTHNRCGTNTHNTHVTFEWRTWSNTLCSNLNSTVAVSRQQFQHTHGQTDHSLLVGFRRQRGMAGSERALGVRQRSTLSHAVVAIELRLRAVRCLKPWIWIGLHLSPGDRVPKG